jgi:hypothetical protein
MSDNRPDTKDELKKWMGKIKWEEPSDQFTNHVMQSVLALSTEEKKVARNGYYWLLMLLPFLIALGWYITTLPELSIKMLKVWVAVVQYYTLINSNINNVFTHFKNITISPLLILGFLAILTLLLLDDIFIKAKGASPSKL